MFKNLGVRIFYTFNKINKKDFFKWSLVSALGTFFLYRFYGLEKMKDEIFLQLTTVFLPFIVFSVLWFLFHFIRAPLEIENDKLKMENNNLKVGTNENNKERDKRIKAVGFLFEIYENIIVNGYSTSGADRLLYGKNRAYDAYWKLENISCSLIYSDEIRRELRVFLDYFTTNQSSPFNCSIKPKYRTESEIKNHTPAVKKVAKYLSNNL